ncbi:hypothetical protein NliqN6_2233 [Naganishia liquefaciens]|uniref:Protein kinase domain-containing protein n=1 Tax=Naganishia liquefaciens TaxID=104408 RepID=A0A8H3TR02_9TREE|nr:hypothetical protein NliqN6_2233 [Naganishia liquefaciens]
MSQRKSPVVQHTLTGPRGPVSRGRSHRPQSKGNLYIANPDSDSDSDDAQRRNGLGTMPATVHPFGTRSSAKSDGLGSRNEIPGSQAGSNTTDQGHLPITSVTTPRPPLMGPQDREWQQQRQQIARGLTVVTQPKTSGMTGLPGSDAHRDHVPDDLAQQQYMGVAPSVMTGMPLGPTSLRHDISLQNGENAVSATAQSSKPSPPLSSASSSVPPALPPRPSTSQQSVQPTNHQQSTINSGPTLSSNGRFPSSAALPRMNPTVASVASPISLGSVPSPIQSSSPSSPSFTYPATRRISKAQQGVGGSPVTTHALPAIPQHSHSTGSLPSSKLGYVRLQVTVDNENFSVVDVSGVTSSEAIMERVFAKLRFRDDDYPSLTMFRTDIGETPDVEPIGKEKLFDVCKAEGDSKGGLKFLVVQTSVLPSPSSMVVPPAILHAGAHQSFSHLGSPVESSRRTFSAGSASQQGDREYSHHQAESTHSHGHSHHGPAQGQGGYAPYPVHGHAHALHHQPPIQYHPSSALGQSMNITPGSRHSKEGSVSSASAAESGSAGMRHSAQSKPDHTVFESSPADVISHNNLFGGSTSSTGGGVSYSSRNQGMTSRRLPSTTTSRGSQSPAEETRVGTVRRISATPPTDGTGTSPFPGPPPPLPPSRDAQQHSFLGGTATPTMAQFGDLQAADLPHPARTPRALPVSQAASHASSPERNTAHQSVRSNSNRVPTGTTQRPDSSSWERSPSEPTEADMAVIMQLELQDAEREKEKKKQMEEEDRKVAMQEQQKEHAAWEAQRNAEREARNRQIEADRLTAELTVQQERERAQREQREIEQLEEARTRQVAKERREKRQQWENRSQMIDRLRDTEGLATMSPEWLYGQEGSTLRPGTSVLPPDITSPPPRQSSVQNNAGPDSLRPSRQQPTSSKTPIRSPHPTAMQSHAYEDAYEGLAPGDSYGAYQDPFMDYRRHSPEPRRRLPQSQAANVSNIGHPNDARMPADGSRRQAASVLELTSSTRPGPGMVEDSIYEDDAMARRRLQYSSHPSVALGSMDRDVQRSLADSRLAAGSAPVGRIPFPEPRIPGFRNDRRGSESVLYENDSPSVHPNSRRKASLADIYDSRPETPGAMSSMPHNDQAPASDGTSAASGSTIVAGRGRHPERQRSEIDDKDDDSGGTARADQWATEIRQMFGGQPDAKADGTLRPNQQTGDVEAAEEPEETLWFVPPSAGTVIRNEPQSPTKPSLHLNIAAHLGNDVAPGSASSAGESDLPTAPSAVDSHDGLAKSARVQRTKSFARTKDQWNERPNPELVYDHLEEFFPKIDLDRPVLPAAPVQLSVFDAASPRTESPEPLIHGHHPSPGKTRSQFNRAENRKSIRIVAEDRKRHLSRIAPAAEFSTTSLERKRSSSMWGHKTIEVTPAKLKRGQVPGVSAEAVLPDGKPETMTWIKGDLIGRGTYGRVYLGLNATTGDMMAVKQVELPTTDRDRQDKRQTSMIKALRDEIELLKHLEHPHIVQYLGWEESGEHISIFLEYVPGGSIASVYRKHQKFEEAVIKNFTKQILEGLSYLHAKGILHRDLKADNILVDSDGTCKITDFGISKQAEDAYASAGGTNLKGSVFWMAPEVIRNMGRGYSAKVDIWSLGCLVLEMFAGRRPWGEDSVLTTMFSVGQHNKRPPVPDDVVLSATANDFMNEKCLAIEPNERPTAEELKRHPFIVDCDPTWTFADSNLGRLVNAGAAKRRQQ